jgi:glycerophosphoryl diester phosphodiesterase
MTTDSLTTNQSGSMNFDGLPRPLIIGHRGFRARFPENTMGAFQAALAAGADMIEMDLRLSADGRVVVIHDARVDRTTDGSGAVEDMTAAELGRLDAGAWFDPAFASVRIPLLEDVMLSCAASTGLQLELKTDGSRTPAAALADAVLAAVDAHGALDAVVFSSFDASVLEALHRRLGAARLALTTRRGAPFDQVLGICRAIRAWAWHPHFSDVTAEKAQAARRAGLGLFAYTVNDPAVFAAMVALGADGVFTDDPERVRRGLVYGS